MALYLGNRWLPRHVVLVTGCREGVLRVYEPASGRWVSSSQRRRRANQSSFPR